MPDMTELIADPTPEPLEQLIFILRGQRVMLSTHLAELYGMLPKALIQAVKRNPERFPEDFLFQLDGDKASAHGIPGDAAQRCLTVDPLHKKGLGKPSPYNRGYRGLTRPLTRATACCTGMACHALLHPGHVLMQRSTV